MQYKRFENNNAANAFAYAIATINLIAVAQFFKAIYIGIFKYLFAAGSKNDSLLRPLLTYFGTVETNSRHMLYFHYLVWLYRAFHLL